MADMVCKNIRDLVYARNEILSENKSLEHEIEILKTCEMPAIMREIEALSRERNTMKEELDQIGAQKNKCEKEAAKMEKLVNQKQAEIQNLTQKNKDLANQCKALEEEIGQYQEEIINLGKYLMGLKRTLDDLNRTAEELMRDIKDTENSVNHLKTVVSQLKKCLKELSEELEDKCNELDNVFQTLKNVENARDQLECKGTDIRRQVLDLQTNLCLVESKIQTEQANMEKLTEKVKEAKAVKECLDQKLHKYKKEMKKIQQRKECHLNEILNVIDEVKDDTTIMRPISERKIKTDKGKSRNGRKSESHNMLKSGRNSSKDSMQSQKNRKRRPAFDLAGDAGAKCMEDALAESGSSELGSVSMERPDVTKNSSCGRQKNLMLDQFINNAQEFRKRTTLERPKCSADGFETRPKSMLDNNPKDDHNRSTGEGLSKHRKKYGSCRSKTPLNKPQSLSQEQKNCSARRTQKIVDKILKELVYSDADDDATLSHDIRAIKHSKYGCKK